MSEQPIDPRPTPGDGPPLPEPHRRRLCELARRAITAHLEGDHEPIRVEDFPADLQPPRATFVTLRKAGELRGCIGTLEAERPLALSVWRNAQQAAFSDPRFPPVSAQELEEIDVHISILSPRVPLTVGSEEELLRLLRPEVDGLVIEDGRHHATFLPAVWESLRDPREFVHELQRKAGLPAGHWSKSVHFWRYTTESFP